MHELRSLTAGLLVYDFANASAVIRTFREVVQDTPDELTLFLVFGRDRTSGDRVVAVSVCWTGVSEDARGRLDSLRSTPGLLLDAVRPTSYLQLQAVFGEVPFGLRHYWKGHFITGMPDELIDFVVEHFTRRRSQRGSVLIEPIQGHARRVPDDATAFANRHAAFNMSGLSIWDSREDDDEQIAWARAFGDGLGLYSSRGGGYLNYMGSDEPRERVQAAFGVEKFARLRELKRKFDPDNVFHQNQNIPPAA